MDSQETQARRIPRTVMPLVQKRYKVAVEEAIEVVVGGSGEPGGAKWGTRWDAVGSQCGKRPCGTRPVPHGEPTTAPEHDKSGATPSVSEEVRPRSGNLLVLCPLVLWQIRDRGRRDRIAG